MRYLILQLAVVLALTGCASRRYSITASQELKKNAARHTDTLLEGILAKKPALFDSILKKNDQWQVRIVYTQVNRDKKNRPHFTNFYYNLDPGHYFYPASTVKMPVAFLALARVHALGLAGLDENTTMITETGYPGQTAVYNDPQSEDGRPTIANYIRKIFLVSDNDAFNRLYEFLGQAYCNERLQKMGYDSTQILHRLQVSLNEEQNRNTNPVRFYDTSGKLLYSQEPQRSNMVYHPRNTKLGKGYLDNKGNLINSPFDFSRKNRIGLADLHSILQSVMLPEAVNKSHRFPLNNQDYEFVYRYMSMKPGESRFPWYDTSYNGAYSKFLLYGGKGDLDSTIRIFNKEGDAYGFLTDVAYIVDFKNGVEFFLSATIYCNSDGIFNDDQYDYKNTGLPFLKNLGSVIYEYELQRKKKHLPDLSKFRISY